MKRLVFVLAILAPAGGTAQTANAPGFVYVWTASGDSSKRGAFMSVFDIRDGSLTAGKLVKALYAGEGTRGTHHTEHALAVDSLLYANDFGTGRTYIFDMKRAGDPRIAASFGAAEQFGWPHSYVRLPNGNRLTTYQWQATKFNTPPGGIAEVTPDGKVLRVASATTPDASDKEVTPYSLEVIPTLDRVVSTTTSMIDDTGMHVQIWRLSDLKLLHTVRIPASPHAGHGGGQALHHRLPGEPRLLADGRTVMMGTFMCGLFTVTDIEGPSPKVTQVYTFEGADCAVPVVIGNYWVQTVPEINSIVVLDVSNPSRPTEASRLKFEPSVHPHWITASGNRIAMNSGDREDPYIYLLKLDPRTGVLSRDERFGKLSVANVDVPGLGTVPGVPHGTVFSH